MTRKTITYKGLSIRDPAPYGEAGAAWQNNFISIADTLDSLQSSVGGVQEALGGLVIGVNIQAYSANLDTWSGVAPSADGQSLVAADDYAAMRGLLGVRPGTDVQGYSALLGAIAGLTPTDGNVIVGDGSTWVVESGATARTSLGFTAPILDRAAPGDIGGTTAGAGTFTTLSATGKIYTPETTSSTIGVVDIGGLRIHGFRHPTGGAARPDGNNIFIGRLAGNFTMGAEATSTTHASLNTGIGYLVLNRLTTGYASVAIGDRALLSVTEGAENTALGRFALGVLTTGTQNVGLGYYAGRYTTGQGDNQTTSNSTYIGASTKSSSDGVINETAIGYAVVGRGSNTVQIGNSLVTDIYISGWLNIPSDTAGLKLDAAGTTTLVSNGTVATLSKPLKTAGYQAADGTAGISQMIAIVDKADTTHTMVFRNGLLTSYTTNP